MGLQKVQETNQIDKFIHTLLDKIDALESRIAQLEGTEGIKYLTLSEGNVSNPPTDAQLDSLFGTPAAVRKGFTSVINDAGLGSNFYMVVSDGTKWWVFTGTVAV